MIHRIPFFKKQFRSKIIATMLIVVVASCSSFGGLVLWQSFVMSEEALLNRVAIEANIISKNIDAAVVFEDHEMAEKLLSTFSSDPAIISARLSTGVDENFAFYSIDAESFDAERLMRVENKVEFEGEQVGKLVLFVSRSELHERNKDVVFFLVVVLSIVSSIALFFCVPIVRSMFAPLLRLHSLSQEVAETRNYTLRAQVSTSDEVGRLGMVINSMLEQIEHRDVMLEKRVAKRTEELEKLAEEFQFRALHDSLTGLPNRAQLNERFESLVGLANSNRSKFGCLLLDLDNFKRVNDTQGHEFGDKLLVEVANRLRKCVRTQDLVCRLGGDEFVILLGEVVSGESLLFIAEKILEQINGDFNLMGTRVKSAVSIGGSVFPDHGEDITTLKRHADMAMYIAKEGGKNRFCLFTEAMKSEQDTPLAVKTSC